MKTYTALFLLFFSLEICAQSNPFTTKPPLDDYVIADLKSTNQVLTLPATTFSDILNRWRYADLKDGALIFDSDNNNLYVCQDFSNEGVIGSQIWSVMSDNMGNHILREDLTIPSGKILMRNHEMYFSNNNFDISVKIGTHPTNYTMQSDGNFVIRNENGDAVWSSNQSIQIHSSLQPIYINNYAIWNHTNNRVGAIYFADPRGPAIIQSGRRLILQSDGNLVFFEADGVTRYASGEVSDRRMKHILSPMENILDRVMEMDLVEFKYKKEESFHVIQPKKLHFGVIAQNILQLFPRYNQDLVTGGSLTSSDRLYVDYRYYNVLAIKAIQEFKIQYDEGIKELRTQVSQKTQTTDLDELKQTFHLLTQKAGEIEKKLSFLDKKTNTKQ